MRFLLIASFPDSLIHFRGALISALQNCGQEVHVAAPDLPAGSPMRAALEKRGLVVHSIPLQRTGLNPLQDLSSLAYLWRLMRNIGPDAVLAYTIKPVVYGLIAGRMAGVPRRFALITGLGFSFQGGGKRGILRRLVQWLYRYALRGAHKVFFQNPDDEMLFRQESILPETSPSVVLNGSGIDLLEYPCVALPEVISFLMIARLLGDKGVREYVDAARQVRLVHPEVVFFLVGWIDENPDSVREEELQQWIEEGVINYLGRLDDVRPSIGNSSVYVLPSYREGTPRTVLEAMAMGRAIITTDAPGCRETVREGINGFLVPVKSVEGLVKAMNFFMADSSLVVSMGRESRRFAAEKYDVHKVNAQMLGEMGLQ